MITKEQVMKALEELELKKASEQDLDQPEGGDLGGGMENKMSDAAASGVEGKKKKKKVKKSDDNDEDDESESDDEDEDKKKKDKPEEDEMDKSFNNLPEEIEAKIDVSDFLKSLVNHTADSINGISKAVVDSTEELHGRYDSMVDIVEDVQKSQAKIGIVLKALCEKVGIIENAPASKPRADQVAKSEGNVEVADRNFSQAEGEKEEKTFKSLNTNPQIAKSQISDAMCDLVRKGEATDVDVISFESNNYIRPEVVEKLRTVLD